MMRMSWSCVLAALVVMLIVAEWGPVSAQPAVGRCPTVVTPPVLYYVPATASVQQTAQPTVVVSGYQPTVIIVPPQTRPAPQPFGARYDESGRLVAISTPQFIGTPSPGFFNSRFRFDENGRLLQISTTQTAAHTREAVRRMQFLRIIQLRRNLLRRAETANLREVGGEVIGRRADQQPGPPVEYG